MGLVVDLRQVLEIEVRVDLRRADVGVAQHLLHAAQVAARLQHVGGEAVAEQVRVDTLAEARSGAPSS